MTEIKQLVRQAVIFELALLCSISVGCTFIVGNGTIKLKIPQQRMHQQQQHGQGTPALGS